MFSLLTIFYSENGLEQNKFNLDFNSLTYLKNTRNLCGLAPYPIEVSTESLCLTMTKEDFVQDRHVSQHAYVHALDGNSKGKKAGLPSLDAP